MNPHSRPPGPLGSSIFLKCYQMLQIVTFICVDDKKDLVRKWRRKSKLRHVLTRTCWPRSKKLRGKRKQIGQK